MCHMSLFNSSTYLVPPPTLSPPTTPRPECRVDDDCPNDKACFDNFCKNPCIVRTPCGVNADCRPVDHLPVCTCLPGYQGNPTLQCTRGNPWCQLLHKSIQIYSNLFHFFSKLSFRTQKLFLQSLRVLLLQLQNPNVSGTRTVRTTRPVSTGDVRILAF